MRSGPAKLGIVLCVGLLSTSRVSAEHPAPLSPEAGCELYIGQASGNDPSVRVTLRLCPLEAGVGGQLQWSSLRSGWNVRDVSGRWEGDALMLRDVRVREERPQPGWRFCVIERYRLRREGERLIGTYQSTACRDQARLNLVRQGDPVSNGRPGSEPGEPREAPRTDGTDHQASDSADEHPVAEGEHGPAPAPSQPPSQPQPRPQPDAPRDNRAPEADTGMCSLDASGGGPAGFLPLLIACAAIRRRR